MYSHTQVQLLSNLELRGELQEGGTHLGAVSIPIFKAMSLDDLTEGWIEKKRGPVTSAKA